MKHNSFFIILTMLSFFSLNFLQANTAGELHQSKINSCIKGYDTSLQKHKIEVLKNEAIKYCNWIHSESEDDRSELLKVWNNANFYQLLKIASNKPQAEMITASCIAGSQMALGPIESTLKSTGLSLGVATHEICIGSIKEGEKVKRTRLNDAKKLVEEYWVIRKNGTFVKEGTHKEFHDNGKMAQLTNYKNDERDGAATFWNENGNKYSEEFYKDGNKSGRSLAFGEKGEVLEEGEYVDGKKNGKWKFFKAGKLTKEIDYKLGKEIKETKYND